MSFRFVEFSSDQVDAVKAFNRRLSAEDVGYQFPETTLPDWLPPEGDMLPNQRYYIALDDADAVRGGYILKHQAFRIGDEVVPIADLRLPLSEGIVDRDFARVGVEILFNSLSKQKLLFGMGIGSESESVSQLFKAGAWRITQIPFFFKVIHPFAFCRKIRFLRRTFVRRLVLDGAAFSGTASVAMRVVQNFRRRTAAGLAGVRVELVDQFDDWADGVWRRSCDQYSFIAVRDCDALKRMYPTADQRLLRLKITDEKGVIGWSLVIDSRMSNHKQFGTLRVGSFVDAMSRIEDVDRVVQVTTAFLENRGVDLIVSNQCHFDWCGALKRAGYLNGPSNYLFASSKALTRLIDTANVPFEQYFLNRGDGDGPINL